MRSISSALASITYGAGAHIFPDHPITAKPLETRQGSGKGALAGWVAPVKPGRVLYEVDGVTLEEAKEALTRAAHKLPVRTMIVVKEEV